MCVFLFCFVLCFSQEHGEVLVLALEETFFKAFLVNFNKDPQEPQLQHKIYPIPAEITQGAGTEVRQLYSMM